MKKYPLFGLLLMYGHFSFAFEKSTQLSVSLGLSSWKDRFSITSPAGVSSDLQVSTLGICPGVSARNHLSEIFLLETTGFAFFGSGDAGFPTDQVPTAFSYSARNIGVFGGGVQVLLWWEIQENAAALGLGMPFLIYGASWPEPGGGYTLNSPNGLGYGFLLALGWERNHFKIAPKMGWFKTFSHLYWNLEVSYQL